MPRRPATRHGFTLIEVLLAIGLSAALMALLASAINLYLLRVDASRGAVEQAQLARGVLRMITDDLRSMAVLYAQDITSAQAAAESQALFDVDEADVEPVELTETVETPRPDVGVSGDANILQVDVLRLRPAYTIDADDPNQPVTMSYVSPGINGVRYFLGEEGLMRQQVSRDVAIQQEQRGLTEAWDASTRLIAAEAVDLRFRYHDGTQALEYWNLEEQQGALPLAVEVRVGLREQNTQQTAEGASEADQAVRYYRVTVPLPVPPGAASATEEESTGVGGA